MGNRATAVKLRRRHGTASATYFTLHKARSSIAIIAAKKDSIGATGLPQSLDSEVNDRIQS
jgi:hypothetical protein